MKNPLIHLAFASLVSFMDCNPCTQGKAQRKIDKLAEKYYKSICFIKQIIEDSETYELLYYHNELILGGDIKATIRKTNCKITCLELSQ